MPKIINNKKVNEKLGKKQSYWQKNNIKKKILHI